MDGLAGDIRYALSAMRRNKGFAAAALLTLTLGIGATTAVFSVVYGILLRPLPYPEADRLVRLSEEHPGAASPFRERLLSNVTYYAWRDSPQTIEWLSAYGGGQTTVILPDGPDHIESATVSTTLLPMLGARPALGRLFVPREGVRGANTVVVLSDRLWRQRFGADPKVIGRSILVEGQPRTIVGVAEPGFYFPDRNALFWQPFDQVTSPEPREKGAPPRINAIHVLARLKRGATTTQAEAEGTARARAANRGPFDNTVFGVGGPVVVHVNRLVDEMTMTVRPALIVLALAVAFVLLIACANVANLLLSRGAARERELAIRTSLGASGSRIARQLLTESLVLSCIGAAFGIALSWMLLRILPAIATTNLPRVNDVRLDAHALLFCAIATLVTSILSGAAPAIRCVRHDPIASLRGGDSGAAGGFRGAAGRRIRDVLLTAEAAFAIVLVIGAMLLARSFGRLTAVDAGYTPTNVLVAKLFAPSRGSDDGRIRLVVTGVLERLRHMPGVVAVGAGNMMPLDDWTIFAGFPAPVRAQEEAAAKAPTARALRYSVTPGYAEALQLRLRKGRFFTDADVASGVQPWIVNEEFARLYLPPDPVGFRWSLKTGRPNEIVGVIANVLKEGNDRRPQPEMYFPLDADYPLSGRAGIAIRTAGDPAPLASIARGIVRDLDPDAAIEIGMLSSRVSTSYAQPRFATAVIGVFALLAMILASVGLYGALSYAVSQRRREFGIRAALGANRVALVWLVTREGLTVTLAGIAIGLVAAMGLARMMRGLLFGISPTDAPSFVAAPIFLVLVATLACVLAAGRASCVEAADALRAE